MRRGPVVAFALSSVVSIVVAVLVLRSYGAHKDGDSVQLVDTRDEVDALLREDAERSSPMQKAPGGQGGEGGIRRPKRRPLTEAEAKTFFPALRGGARFAYDEVAYMTLKPGQITNRAWPESPDGAYRREVNAQGFTRDTPLSDVAPALRVLVVGDSHLEGVVSTAQNLCSVMEAELALARPGQTVEVLNAGQGGTAFYNYLAVVERHLELNPDVVICLAYTGNDFDGSVTLRRLFESIAMRTKTSDAAKRALGLLRESKSPGAGQGFIQAATFAGNSQYEEIGLDAGCEVIGELARTCEASGVEFICARLPSAIVAQPARYRSLLDEAKATMNLGGAPFEVEPRISRAWMQRLGDAGIEVVDLAERFEGADRDLYWHSDLHLAIEGHRITGEVLARHVENRVR